MGVWEIILVLGEPMSLLPIHLTVPPQMTRRRTGRGTRPVRRRLAAQGQLLGVGDGAFGLATRPGHDCAGGVGGAAARRRLVALRDTYTAGVSAAAAPEEDRDQGEEAADQGPAEAPARETKHGLHSLLWFAAVPTC